jgi:hypothetical protein
MGRQFENSIVPNDQLAMPVNPAMANVLYNADTSDATELKPRGTGVPFGDSISGGAYSGPPSKGTFDNITPSKGGV